MNIEEQNGRVFLERISASDKLLMYAEILTTMRFIICVLLVDVLSIIRIWNWVSVFYCNFFILYCAISALMWKFFEVKIGYYRMKSVKILHWAGCELFNIRWNPFLCGDKPLPEDIYPRISKNLNKYVNYFSDRLSGLEDNVTIISCFRIHVIKGIRQLQSYEKLSTFIFIVSIIIVSISSIIITASNINAKLLYLVVASVPLVVWYSSICDTIRKTKEINGLILLMCNDSIEDGFSLDMKDMIYDYFYMQNKEKYVVPRWFLLPGEKKREKIEMNYVADYLRGIAVSAG